ncbi:D-Ala-D-Ala carboxypeptidase family metallohydrolase [Rikenella microfusus]|uniref:Zinc D-Ala-D-Ala carboxypeptidase n=1 Tax=Rikenella microfusus TaxID=28139 RepID=A0A379MNT7_9BACT|nr:D-Ala-D-Ala carboxypeptidase family metallohydrolase [Rikenella microfusus]SUE33394.1 Zinc D-Ala-D-Ala carboxypeptidase precursor [Rikenella microfusus]
MKYFTIAELCRSSTADNKRIDNTPAPEIREKLQTLIEELLDPIREAWGKPIRVNSGYRCPALNQAVGGVSTSQHQKGEAADLNAGDPTKNRELFDKIVEMQKTGRIAFDQLIDEAHYRWVHISYRKTGNRGQVLHL